jgi:hypothetical protein
VAKAARKNKLLAIINLPKIDAEKTNIESTSIKESTETILLLHVHARKMHFPR